VAPRFVLILQLTSSRVRHYSTVVEMLALLWYGIISLFYQEFLPRACRRGFKDSVSCDQIKIATA
jgi:hypothetical protein